MIIILLKNGSMISSLNEKLEKEIKDTKDKNSLFKKVAKEIEQNHESISTFWLT